MDRANIMKYCIFSSSKWKNTANQGSPGLSEPQEIRTSRLGWRLKGVSCINVSVPETGGPQTSPGGDTAKWGSLLRWLSSRQAPLPALGFVPFTAQFSNT